MTQMKILGDVYSVVQALGAGGATIFAILLLYCGMKVIRNVWFHPLSGFPGPKLVAATSLWYARGLTRGTLPMDVLRLHDKYGPIVRVAPDELSFIDASAWKDIYGHKKPGQLELRKDKNYATGISTETTIISANQEHHRALRKMLAPSFSDSALRAQEPVIQAYVKTLMTKLYEISEGGSTTVNIAEWFNFFSFDVIGYLSYGESFNCLGSSRLQPWPKLIMILSKLAAYSQAMMRLPRIFRLPYALWYFDRSIKTSIEVEKQLNSAKVNYRIENTSNFPDLMGKLIEAYHTGKISYNQLTQNAKIINGAGSETSSTLLSGLVYLLTTHPNALQRLTKEIRNRFTSAEDITITSTSGCKFLLACVEEAFRLYPPSPGIHSRYTPSGGMIIGGRFIPKDTAVGISIMCASRSRKNFYDPDNFRPERWMGEDPDFGSDIKDALQPFSVGPRDCVGKNLAYAEIKLVMAHLIWQFDVENRTQGDWLNQRVFLVWDKPPLMVKLRSTET